MSDSLLMLIIVCGTILLLCAGGAVYHYFDDIGFMDFKKAKKKLDYDMLQSKQIEAMKQAGLQIPHSRNYM